MLDTYIDLFNPTQQRGWGQHKWSLPVADSDKLEPAEQASDRELHIGKVFVDWLPDDWKERFKRSSIVNCRQEVWTRKWNEGELERYYVVEMERWRVEAEVAAGRVVGGKSCKG